jgi:uncharacterized protein (DUF2252 family)
MTTIAPAAHPGPAAAERAAAGKARRDRVPRSAHSAWTPPPDRPDPLAVLAEAGRGRVDRLMPLRNARMAVSPFAFFRGAADIMAADLATTPVTGINVQLCGDAHCLNFGAFATAERRLIFDVNDFDETLAGPWEWDIKRLATSLVLAARSIKLKNDGGTVVVLAALRAYRLKLLEYAAMTAIETWYARIDAADVDIPDGPDKQRARKAIVESAHANSARAALDKITHVGVESRQFVENPPLLYHAASAAEGDFDIDRVFRSYIDSLTPEVRVLLGRYRLVDHAVKVVGVGSVGTRCAVALLQADGDDALILQIKQACASVLERYVGASPFVNHGERVVHGQRLMQTASDALLGWGTSGEHDFYVRQYRDKKGSIDIAALDGFGLREYGEMCARALAKSHARSGDAVQIAGYLGKGDTFDKALARFAVLYADQAEADFRDFRAAIEAGKIPIAKV